MVRVVVADDHPAYAHGVARILTEHCGARVVACCADGRTALAAIVEHRPDIAMVDLRMAPIGGRAVLAEVVRLRLGTRVVVCSAHVTPALAHAVIEDGARGYVSKTAGSRQLRRALREVLAGEVWMSADVQAAFNVHIASGRRALSPREAEVLQFVAEGLTDGEIGATMYISSETVRTNLKRCSEKLGVSHRAALAITALREGLIE